MIHNSVINKIMEKKTPTGKPAMFSMEFITLGSGGIVTGEKCQCLSSHYRPRTYNIKWVDSGAIRKIRHISIIKINDQDVYE
jgi:hypothetical protein